MSDGASPPSASYPYTENFYLFDYKSVADQVPDRYTGTCSWIITTDEFLEWRDKVDSPILWIHGYPGMGKSVFAKYLLETLESSQTNSQPDCFVLHFFCAYRHLQCRSLHTLLASLIYQLLSQAPHVINTADSLRNKITRTWREPDVQSALYLRTLLSDLMEQYCFFQRQRENHRLDPPIYIVIDALDELERRHWGPFIALLAEMTANVKLNFRIVITSRTEPEFEERILMSWDIDLGLAHDTMSDVARYVEGTVSEYGKANNFGEVNIANIIKELTEKAEGSFLWASLAWAFFIDGVGVWSMSLVRNKLDGLRHIPPGMDSIYYRIMSSVDQSLVPDLYATLQWIIVAARPITVDELAVALAIRSRPQKYEDVEPIFNIRAFLKKSCPHLVKVDDTGVIKLVHLSFKTYLHETSSVLDGEHWKPNTFYVDLKQATMNIGLDCLSYLTLNEFLTESLEEVLQHELFPYARQYWLFHLQSRNDETARMAQYFLKLFEPYTKECRWYNTGHLLFQLSKYGLESLLKLAGVFGVNLNVFNDTGNHLIHHIVSQKKPFPLEMVRPLIDHGLDVNGRSSLQQTVLFKYIIEWHDRLGRLGSGDSSSLQEALGTLGLSEYIAAEDDEGSIDFIPKSCADLLSFPDIDINAEDAYGFTPLSYTVHWGMTAGTVLLQSCSYFSPIGAAKALRIAVKEGVYEAVDALLQRGVHPSGSLRERDTSIPEIKRYGSPETALHLAAAYGHLRILQLLAAKADIALLNAKDTEGWTIAHRGIVSGNDALVHWIIQNHDVDLGIKDKYGRRPIAFAAAFGSRSILEALITRTPSDLRHEDTYANTLLHMAARGGNVENFAYLLTRNEIESRAINRSGKSFVDLAPTILMDQYLHGLGYEHSSMGASSCFAILELQREAAREELERQGDRGKAGYVLVDSSKWICCGDSDKECFNEERRRAESQDKLGQRMGSIYAIN